MPLTLLVEIRKMDSMRRWLPYLLYFCLVPPLVHADAPPFDLSGPNVDVHVKRGDVTLPVSEVPNLLPGDRLWVHPDLPESQATHFVLVVAFLRGSTNPPPPDWFTRVETWTRQAHDEGVFVNVPSGAQQALLFLAPETGGDFNTLRKAVQDEPGSFVRAAQDLQAASWERMRLETYLSDVKVTSQFDPTALKTRAELAARSLGIKINENCFLKPVDQQASCLSQNSEGMVLDDANAQSLLNQLTTGSALDLVNQLSATTLAGAGAYSPYIGAIVDTARILASLHTAHFQYIPALALPKADSLNLRLNMPPSFRNPKSVVVVALPPIGSAFPEPLHPVDAGEESLCALKPRLILPAEGAPLVFATEMAHDLVLQVETTGSQKGPAVDVPLVADPARGGLVPTETLPKLPAGELVGVVRGKWGFDDWEGPEYRLFTAQSGMWSMTPADQTALVVGRDDTLHFEGESSVCVEKVEAQTSGGHMLPVAWKSPKPDSLFVTVPLKDAEPGSVTVAVYQYGLAKPDHLALQAYDAEASLDSLTLSSGDKTALLKGTRLDEVANAQVGGISFTPSTLKRVDNLDQLVMNASGSTASLDPLKPYVAHVELKDSRMLKAPVTVEPPRPEIALLSKGVQEDGSAESLPVQLGSPDDLPVEGRLVFFLRSVIPAVFPRDEKIEVASDDMSFDTTLAMSDGSLMLENADTAVARLEPLERFGSSAFGRVRVRAIAADGVAGDWVPLGTFVRLPGFKELRCPRYTSKPCILNGSDLFLAASFASASSFDNPTDVPPAFTGTQLVVPHPVNGVLYLKLLDDPATVQALTLPITPISSLASEAPALKSPPVISPPAPSTPAGTPSAPSPADTVPAAKPEPGTNEPSPPSAPPTTPEATPPAQPATKPGPAATQPPASPGPQASPQAASPAKTSPVGNPAPVTNGLSTGSAPAAGKAAQVQANQGSQTQTPAPPPN
jgi:hypothetical protein